jgi:hypothetical protein
MGELPISVKSKVFGAPCSGGVGTVDGFSVAMDHALRGMRDPCSHETGDVRKAGDYSRSGMKSYCFVNLPLTGRPAGASEEKE